MLLFIIFVVWHKYLSSLIHLFSFRWFWSLPSITTVIWAKYWRALCGGMLLSHALSMWSDRVTSCCLFLLFSSKSSLKNLERHLKVWSNGYSSDVTILIITRDYRRVFLFQEWNLFVNFRSLNFVQISSSLILSYLF